MKKIFNTILSIAAVMFTLSSCSEKDINLGSRVSLSQTDELQVPAESAGAFSLGIESDGDWVVVVPSWITASPRHGSGNGVVTLNFEDNYSIVTAENGDVSREMNGVRHGTVSVECASGATSFVVRQDGDPNKPSDEVVTISIGEFLTKPDGPQKFQITGTVTKIANTTYGNLYLNDGTGEVYVYGMLDRDGNTKNFGSLGIGVGDVVTVHGSKTTYNGTTIEIVNAQYISHVKSIIALAETEKKIPADETEFTVGVDYKGDLKVVSDSQWLAFTGLTSEGISFKAFENTDAARTATVTVTATSEGKTASAELKVIQAGASVGGGNVFKKVTTVTSGKQYIIVAGGKLALPIAADRNYGYLQVQDVTETNGTITLENAENAFTIESTTGGYTIKQADGRYLYQTGTYNSFNVNAAPTEGQVWSITANADGTVKILNTSVNKYMQLDSQYGTYGSYDSEKGAMPAIYELSGEGTPGGGGNEDGIKTVTVAEFNAAAESNTQKYKLTGTISGTINTTYGNFDLVDDSGSVYVYGLTATDNGYGTSNDKSYASLGLKAGDKITIIGYRGSFNGKIEVMYAYFVSKQ
ncbi:MAG: BACON domain-containing protein [Bacteroidales bacterium]|nr:BACON domain-containing protein [Bacteroidales bacterium]